MVSKKLESAKPTKGRSEESSSGATRKRFYDNTRLSDFKSCPRKYFFRHVMGWASSKKSAALAFGGAWGAAMDAMWSAIHNGYDRDATLAVSEAAWVQSWIDAGMPDPEEFDAMLVEEFKPRTPMTAREMLMEYYAKRVSQIRAWELVEIEKPFGVPLRTNDPDLFYVGRMDKVVRAENKRLRGIEHKTTTASKADSFSKGHPGIRPAYIESFSPNAQIDGYLYALHMLYPEESRFDVWVDAALVNAKGEDFRFIPIEHKLSALDSWLFDTNQWVTAVEEQLVLLREISESDGYLAAFPKNTNSCFDFNTPCVFLPICKARPNPLTYTEPPGDLIHSPWDPLAHIKKVTGK